MIAAPKRKDVRDWWAVNPMTYGSDHGVTTFGEASRRLPLGAEEFFNEVDETFYKWNMPLHDSSGPFGRLFPYERFRGKRVLEVGCGMGTMAMNWARRGAIVQPVDLNPVAAELTGKRMRLNSLPVHPAQADANCLPFPAAGFDYVYSWGVLHHSPKLDLSIAELLRVLKPGGEFGVMLYFRPSFLYRYFILFREGFLHGESDFLSPLERASRYTDGERQEGNPHTWPVTKAEMRRLFAPLVREVRFRVFGTDLDFLLTEISVFPGLARRIPRAFKKALARRWGWSLWISGVK
jgi:ubiquinone/menaquinone biosynthesis C-methylase UbiE